MAHITFAQQYQGLDKSQRCTVAKFGGTSLGEASRLIAVSQIVAEEVKNGKKPIVIVSAMGKTTNMLLAAAKKALDEGEVDISDLKRFIRKIEEDVDAAAKVVFEIEELLTTAAEMLRGVSLLKELSAKTTDAIMSFGERISCRIVAGVLNSSGIPAKAIDSYDVGMVTSSGSGSGASEHSSVEVLLEAYTQLRETFEPLADNYSYTPVVTGFIGGA
eukprot:GHVN01071155.1.p2 GENE.GHVN01071155.1~~GHVN01071155.1.p2  ORF type:complete len:217 (-),score=35.47 GHVN01071155.1:958-1608(-)